MQYLRYGSGGENDQIFNSAYGDAGYNYAASGYPDPGQFIGQVSPFWQQAGLPLLPQRYAGPQTSGGPRLAVPEGLSTFNRASVPGTPEYALATGDMTGLPDWQAAQIASQLNANNLGVAP